MSFEEQSRGDELFEQVKETLAGKRFSRPPWYCPSGKVFMLISAGDEAKAVNDLFIAIREYASTVRDTQVHKEDEKRKVMQALEDYLALVQG
jgi:hypothetical protein